MCYLRQNYLIFWNCRHFALIFFKNLKFNEYKGSELFSFNKLLSNYLEQNPLVTLSPWE